MPPSPRPGATSTDSIETARRADAWHRLGLESGSPTERAVEAHERITAFLAGAPTELRAWARSETTATDAAFAVLVDAGPTEGGQPASPPPDATPAPTEPRAVADAGMAPDSPARRPHRRGLRLVAIVAGVAAVGLLAVAVHGMNRPAASSPTTIAGLLDRIDPRPADTAALMDIGNAYYAARDYTVAATIYRLVRDTTPDAIDPHLALGAALFGLGDLDAAEATWREAAALDPTNIELLFNLGVVALNRVPPDVTAVEAAWGEVLRLAPDSSFAASVRAGLTELRAATAPSPGSSPAAASSPAASTTARPAPTGSAGT
jgi:tetratricopeptide (TPR) repeat protein